MSSYCAISPTSSAPWLRRRATTLSMSSTANMMRRMPSVFAGALSGSALTAGGVWNFVSSTRLWPSGVRIMAMSARTSLSPTTRSTQRPSTVVSPSSSIPSSAKNALAASRRGAVLGSPRCSGAPMMAGLIAAAVGGIVVGALGGAPLQVAGSAAGLTVMVYGLVQQYGFKAVGAITVAAAVLQMILGAL